MRFYVYILYSPTLDRYYIGSTSSLEGRLAWHLASNKGFTSKAKDWVLRYSECFETRAEARRREFQIKRWKSRAMIEKLIGA